MDDQHLEVLAFPNDLTNLFHRSELFASPWSQGGGRAEAGGGREGQKKGCRWKIEKCEIYVIIMIPTMNPPTWCCLSCQEGGKGLLVGGRRPALELHLRCEVQLENDENIGDEIETWSG